MLSRIIALEAQRAREAAAQEERRALTVPTPGELSLLLDDIVAKMETAKALTTKLESFELQDPSAEEIRVDPAMTPARFQGGVDTKVSLCGSTIHARVLRSLDRHKHRRHEAWVVLEEALVAACRRMYLGPLGANSELQQFVARKGAVTIAQTVRRHCRNAAVGFVERSVSPRPRSAYNTCHAQLRPTLTKSVYHVPLKVFGRVFRRACVCDLAIVGELRTAIRAARMSGLRAARMVRARGYDGSSSSSSSEDDEDASESDNNYIDNSSSSSSSDSGSDVEDMEVAKD